MLLALGLALLSGLPVAVVLIGVALLFASIALVTGAMRTEELGAIFHRLYGTLSDRDFVDLSELVEAGGERGLLGLAFHPSFAANGRVFVHYSRRGDGATVISELTASADRTTADPASERIIFTHDQPFANHNGGEIAFGPDGYLYIGLGDGGSGGDPFGNAQNLQVLLGKTGGQLGVAVPIAVWPSGLLILPGVVAKLPAGEA